MSTPQQSYPYDQLPKDGTFRYFILQPGAGHEPLVCNLHTAQIADIEYHSISYVWGTEIKDQTILCNGHVMKVTLNLFKALQCIRLPDRPLALWADSICINQEDRNEKGHQVSLMGKVYRSAKCVLIYIGSDDNGHGPHVCSLVDEVDEMIQSTCKRLGMTWNSFPDPEKGDRLLSDPRWDSLYEAVNEEWFDRGWVVQEAALAVQGEVIWGKSRFSWQKLMHTWLWLGTRGTETFIAKDFARFRLDAHAAAYRRGHEDLVRAFYTKSAWRPLSLLRMLDNARGLSLKDPRDRIYAFMDLSQDNAHRIIIDPNYFAPYLEVYRDFAVTYIQSTKSIDILDFVRHNDETFSDSPSWVPRWDNRDRPLPEELPNSFTLQPRVPCNFEPVVTGDGKLKVRGVIIDTIHYTSELFSQTTTTAETIQRHWDRISTIVTKSPYKTSDTSESALLSAFLGALCMSAYIGHWAAWLQALDSLVTKTLSSIHTQQLPRKHQSHIEKIHSKLQSRFSRIAQPLPLKKFAVKARLKQAHVDNNQPSFPAATDSKDNMDFNLVLTRIIWVTDRCRLIFTERGYMGLAPSIVREGDVCGIIFGCKTPCILRKAAQNQHYRILGAAPLIGKEYNNLKMGGVWFKPLGQEDSKDWVDWDVEEQDIYLC